MRRTRPKRQGTTGPARKARPPRTTHKIRAIARLLIPWFNRAARDLPWRHTRDPYAVWISEIMLQQTQVATVVPYYDRWMKALPDLQSLARASSQQLHKLWEGLGYYTRVRNLQRAARVICAQHGGRFPDHFEAILQLPGIGRYTAGAICSIAFNEPTPVLDGNVMRVLTRVFGISEDPREPRTNAGLWDLAARLVEEAARETRQPAPCSALNQSLMELGATVCIPRNPRCPQCPIRGRCTAYRDGSTARLPVSRARPASIVKQVQAFAVQHRGRFLILRRPEDGLNGGLWEFPSREVAIGTPAPRPGSTVMGIRIQAPRPIGKFQHSITRFRITLHAFQTHAKSPVRPENGRWLTPGELNHLPLSAAHRRIAQLLPRPAPRTT